MKSNSQVTRTFYPLIPLTCLLLLQCGSDTTDQTYIDDSFAHSVIVVMIEKYGDAHQERITTGVTQVQQQWQKEDGDHDAFQSFCLDNFIPDEDVLKQSFDRLERAFENLDGHLIELGRELQWHLDVETGPILPIDYLLATFDLSSHVSEDLYKSKIAFYVLLNYPVHTLEECLALGNNWTRKKWAETRLAQKFTARVPAHINQSMHQTFVAADQYISNYNIYMNNLLTEDGTRLFPKDLKLIAHWGLRDELKAQYGEPDGFPRQQMIYSVMQKIISQQIPTAVINNPAVDWIVSSNKVVGGTDDNSPEPNTRYEHLQTVFQSIQNADPFYPLYPNYIERRFSLYREIQEEVVRQLFIDLLTSEEFIQTGARIRKRLGRELQPFDIWYTGFRSQANHSQQELDKLVAKKYPTATAFHEGLPHILQALGFNKETATFLQSKIAVDPSRGAGHAMGAGRRSDQTRLRTRVLKKGMNYKGYNIAIHELGHNVEQVFSLNEIDHTLLEGVPNTAFTEAFAFVFQNRDLELLSLGQSKESIPQLEALNRLWAVCEIAGVSLVDMNVWHWMYDHTNFSTDQLKTAVQEIAKEIWNEYFYPILGHRDSPILAIYSHMIYMRLYLPDYPIGHIIAFQIEEYIRNKNLATEMERMCTLGNVTPDYWMQQAVGQPISVNPILAAAREALVSKPDHTP